MKMTLSEKTNSLEQTLVFSPENAATTENETPREIQHVENFVRCT